VFPLKSRDESSTSVSASPNCASLANALNQTSPDVQPDKAEGVFFKSHLNSAIKERSVFDAGERLAAVRSASVQLLRVPSSYDKLLQASMIFEGCTRKLQLSCSLVPEAAMEFVTHL